MSTDGLPSDLPPEIHDLLSNHPTAGAFAISNDRTSGQLTCDSFLILELLIMGTLGAHFCIAHQSPTPENEAALLATVARWTRSLDVADAAMSSRNIPPERLTELRLMGPNHVLPLCEALIATVDEPTLRAIVANSPLLAVLRSTSSSTSSGS